MEIDQSTIDEKASEVREYIINACQDMAFENGRPDAFHWQEPELQAKIKKAKKNGVLDIAGWLADEYYDDVYLLQDLAGDKIFDAAESHEFSRFDEKGNAIKIAIAESIKEYGHHSMIKAMNNLIKRWKE